MNCSLSFRMSSLPEKRGARTALVDTHAIIERTQSPSYARPVFAVDAHCAAFSEPGGLHPCRFERTVKRKGPRVSTF